MIHLQLCFLVKKFGTWAADMKDLIKHVVQMFGGSLLDSLYPSNDGELALDSGHSYDALWLPAAAPLQLYGYSELPQAWPPPEEVMVL